MKKYVKIIHTLELNDGVGCYEKPFLFPLIHSPKSFTRNSFQISSGGSERSGGRDGLAAKLFMDDFRKSA